jgi:hypothetical protein
MGKVEAERALLLLEKDELERTTEERAWRPCTLLPWLVEARCRCRRDADGEVAMM